MGQARTILKSFIEALNAHELECAMRWIAADFSGMDIGEAQPIRDHAEFSMVLEKYLVAFPDLNLEIEDILERGNRAAMRWRATGTHTGALIHIPPTGKRVTVGGTWVVTFKRGQIHSGDSRWDMAGLLRGLGLLPALPVTRPQALEPQA